MHDEQCWNSYQKFLNISSPGASQPDDHVPLWLGSMWLFVDDCDWNQETSTKSSNSSKPASKVRKVDALELQNYQVQTVGPNKLWNRKKPFQQSYVYLMLFITNNFTSSLKWYIFNVTGLCLYCTIHFLFPVNWSI